MAILRYEMQEKTRHITVPYLAGGTKLYVLLPEAKDKIVPYTKSIYIAHVV